MRVDESLDRQLSSTLMHSHQLWAGSNFDESQWEVWLVESCRSKRFPSHYSEEEEKKENIITYHRQVTGLSAVWQASKNEEKEVGKQRAKTRKSKNDSRQLSCNSHCSFDRAMRVEETLMQILACQLSSTVILVWSRLLVSLPRFTTMYFHSIDILMIRWMIVVYQEKNELQVNLKESAWYLIMRDLVWE